MPFCLKNAPSEFQNIMNDIFNSFSHFTIVYIDDVLVYSSPIDEHWKHLYSFLDTIKRNGLVVSAKKIKLFQTKVRFLGLISLKDKYVLLIEPFNLLINFLMLSLIKPSSKDFLDHWIMLLIFIRIWGNNVNHSLIGYKVILHLGLMSILPLLNRSNLMLRHCRALVFLLLMLSKLLKLLPLTLVMEVF